MATVFLHEFHGGIHDGLVMGNHKLFQEVLLPLNIQISTEKDYLDWTPKAGDVVVAYRYVGPPRKVYGSAVPHHHLYMQGATVTLRDRKTT